MAKPSSPQEKLHLSASSISASAGTLFCMIALDLFSAASAEQALELQDSVQSQHSDYGAILAVCVSAAAFLILLVLVLTSCTDCYNSEVSTDFHPATGNTGVKWGGAGGYSAAAASDVNDRVLGAGFTGEAVVPGQGSDQALPYTMIPTQVPEAQGFRGYGAAPPAQGLSGYTAGGGGGNLAGYGGGGGWEAGGGRPQRLPGAHVSPMNGSEPEDPPPSYFSSAN